MEGLPENVQRVLDGFVQAAQTAFGSDLVSVVLYGSAAEGRMRATSDVNLIVVLRRFDGACAARIRDPLNLAETAEQDWLPDAGAVIDDRTLGDLSDDQLRHGLIFELSSLSHDDVARTWFVRLLSTADQRLR